MKEGGKSDVTYDCYVPLSWSAGVNMTPCCGWAFDLLLSALKKQVNAEKNP